MRCPAFLIALEFAVTLPDHAAVLAVGMPHLGTVKFSAVTADDLRGKQPGAVMILPNCFSPLELRLYMIPFVRVDDGRVAVLNIVLRYLALIDFHFLLEKIHCEAFLKERCALVFLVGEDTLHRRRVLLLFPLSTIFNKEISNTSNRYGFPLGWKDFS